jgi:PAS domain S-box-containing protein
LFGLHQCSYPRTWTAQEERLFQELGRRLGDGLTGLLMLRNLRESEGKLEEAQHIAHVGHWDHDLDTDSFTWSDEIYRIFGLPLQEKSNTSAVLKALIHPEDWESHTRASMSAQRGGPPYNVEYRVVRPNGEVRIVHSRGDVTTDEAGRPRRMFGIVQDITERKQSEEILRESERRNREAQADLARAARLTTMGELTTLIAHEVSQPLMAIVTNAGACLSWLTNASPNIDAARQAAERVVRNGHRAGSIVKSIRALARKSEPEMAQFDINDAIGEILVLLRNELRKQSVLLETELSDGLKPVTGDRVQLQQVVLNLVMNGIEAMSAVMDRPRILRVISQPQQPGDVLIAVTDVGTGLDPANMDRIFNGFFTTKPKGMGMGLAICRSIIEAHGGELWASPQLPHGSVFQFTVRSRIDRRATDNAA